MKILVDKEDEWLLETFKWNTASGYANCHILGQGREAPKLMLHHAIAGQPLYRKVIDHRNRNPLDNRRNNLRIITQSRNILESKINKNNSSGYTGVSFHKSSGKFQAYVKLNYKNIYLGLFDSIEEANQARLTRLKGINI